MSVYFASGAALPSIKTVGFHFATCLAPLPRMQRLCQLLQSEGFQVFVHTEQPEPAAEALARLLGLPHNAVLVADYDVLRQKLSQRGCRAYFSGDADMVADLNAQLTRPLACYINA